MTLYAAAPESVPTIRCSPPSWAAQLALLLSKAPHEVTWLRFDRGDHRGESYLAVNPEGTVPALRVEGEEALNDTQQILERISALGVGAPQPGDEASRALAEATKVGGMRALRGLMKGEQGDALWSPLREALDGWEARFSRPSRDASATLTVPELLCFVYTTTARSLGLSLENWPEVAAFVAATEALEAVQRAWPSTWRG